MRPQYLANEALTVCTLMLRELLGWELVGVPEEEQQFGHLVQPTRLLTLHKQLEGGQVVVLSQKKLDPLQDSGRSHGHMVAWHEDRRHIVCMARGQTRYDACFIFGGR